jgi:type IV pilus assembly protein PilW
MASDIQMAGYWGELSTFAAAPGGLPDPCTVLVQGAGSLEEAIPLHIQGYNNPDPLALTCVSNHKAGTDVLVVRRLDPDTSDMETAGVIVPTQARAGQVYMQTGLSGLTFASVFRAADGTTDAAAFNLKKRDGTPGNIRKMVVNIYYVSTCSICTGTPDTIPTLKRVELGVTANLPAFQSAATIAEGIEHLQIDYGVDTIGNGQPVGADVATVGAAGWADVMTLKINLLARSAEVAAGHQDTKSYALGATGGTVAAANDGYKRHVFVQSVRMVNPSGRRVL